MHGDLGFKAGDHELACDVDAIVGKSVSRDLEIDDSARPLPHGTSSHQGPADWRGLLSRVTSTPWPDGPDTDAQRSRQAVLT